MKTQTIVKLTLAIFTAFGLVACNDTQPAHDHDHDHDDDHDHHQADGHSHDSSEVKHVRDPGPNGGRVLHGVEPHLEFFVTESRHVRITQLDDSLKPVAMGDQEIRITAGDRSHPVNLELAREGDVLVSTTPFPEGDDFPVVVQIKSGSEEAVFEKFTMDFTDCPTCDYLEYACICEHGEGHGDHDHKHE